MSASIGRANRGTTLVLMSRCRRHAVPCAGQDRSLVCCLRWCWCRRGRRTAQWQHRVGQHEPQCIRSQPSALLSPSKGNQQCRRGSLANDNRLGHTERSHARHICADQPRALRELLVRSACRSPHAAGKAVPPGGPCAVSLFAIKARASTPDFGV